MWGESPEEQEKRREWLRGVYDRATQPEQSPQQGNDNDSSFGQVAQVQPASSTSTNNKMSIGDLRRLNYKYAPEITPETWSYDKKAVSSDEQRQQSVANYPLNHPVYQNPQQSEMQNNEPPYLEFTGQKLKWNEGNKTVRSFNGMAGKIGYQNAQDQEIPDYGPIPEGEWNVPYTTRQSYPRDKETWGKRDFGAWGHDYVRLEPAPETNTYGRNQFTIHGGKKLGSAGCIDLAGEASDFMRYLDDYGNDIKLKVNYPNQYFGRRR